MAQTTIHSSLRVGISNRQILNIAIPISFGILVPQLNFITNNIFLGRLSEQALATAAITGVYYLIFAAIGFGLNNGLQALISRRAGENRPGEIGKLFIHGVGLSMGIAVVGIVLTYTLSPWVLKLSIHDAVLREQAVSFLKIRIWGLPFLYVYQMRNALLVGTNQSRYLVAGTIAEAVSNIFFDYGFIFGHFGFPALGFNGAAIASIIAEFMGMSVVFAVIHFKGIEHHGERDLSISNTMRNIFGLFGMFSWALAATCSSMVSNIIGQGLQDRVLELIFKVVKISTGIALFVFVLLNIFPQLFLSIYGQNNDWVTHAIPVMRIVSSALVFMSFSVVCVSAVYIWWVLEHLNLSIVVGWMSEWIYWGSMFTLSFLYLRSGKWKGKVI
jgi:MATE family multidrug resistance protein